jgi:4'-phosphopantetheinyl transferase
MELPAMGTVHVWLAGLELPEAHCRQLAVSLTPDERERAACFRSDLHRRRFVVGRGLLRAILGAYLGLDPGRIGLAKGPAGKPYLAGIEAPIAFNLAHSDDLAVCAVATSAEVGVDVERLRPMPDMLHVAACCFSERERAFLTRLAGAERVGAFFRAWTRKEAWLKATGHGLVFGPEGVEVTLGAGEPARLLAVAGLPDAPQRWSLHDLPLRPGYAAALAASGPVQHRLCRAWAWGRVPRASPPGSRFCEQTL